MKCPNCGVENSSDVNFCTSCGAPLPKEAPETPKKQPMNAEAFKAKVMPILKNKFVWLGVGALILVIILISVISAIAKSDNGYIELKRVINPIENDDEIVLVANNKLLKKTIPGEEIKDSDSSLDMNTVAIVNNDGDLYTLVGSKLKKVDTDVDSVELSVTGGGLVYTKEDDDTVEYYHYILGKKPVKLDDDIDEFVISPDGKSVVYTIVDSEDDDVKTTTYFFNGKKAEKISSANLSLQGMSNGGKYIYATSENDDGELILYVLNQNGEKNKLHQIDFLINSYYYEESGIYFNYDHTQVLFYSDGKTFMSTKGKDPQKISSKLIELVLTEKSVEKSGTYPVKNLYDHIFTDGDGVWLIKKNDDKSVKLVSNASSLTLDSTASYLYYTYDYEELRVIKIKDGEKASDKAKTIVRESVSNYVITSDRSLVYYISDNELHSVNGKNGKKDKTISRDDVESYYLAISDSDTAYYVMDGDLYACSNGKKGTKVLSDCDYIFGLNGIVYAESDNTLYATKTSKKLKKLVETEE